MAHPASIPVSLYSGGQAVGSITLAAGDVRVKIGSGAWGARSDIPTVSEGNATLVLTTAERAASTVEFAFHDQDGTDFDDTRVVLVDEGPTLADTILKRGVGGLEADAAEHSLVSAILYLLEWATSGGTLTVKRADGVTTHLTRTVATAAADEVITGVS